MELESAISLSPTTLVLKCFSGHDIASNRIIELVCKLHPDEARTCKETFYVYPTPIVDMVLGIVTDMVGTRQVRLVSWQYLVSHRSLD